MSVTLLPHPQPQVSHLPYVNLSLLQIADVLTTGVILGSFAAASEGNLIARLFTDHGAEGLTALLALKLLTVMLLWTCQTPVRFAKAIYGAVIVNNMLALALYSGLL